MSGRAGDLALRRRVRGPSANPNPNPNPSPDPNPNPTPNPNPNPNEAAARRPDSLTFDASPVHLQSRIAPPWLLRFLPTARLIVLLRDPVQRAYSHWKVTLTRT